MQMHLTYRYIDIQYYSLVLFKDWRILSVLIYSLH